MPTSGMSVMHRLVALVCLVACSHDSTPASPPPTEPLAVPAADAVLADACESKLRALAKQLGDPTPALRAPSPLHAGRAEQLDCPASSDDAACERLARAHVTVAANETATVAIGAIPELAYYELTYSLDGAKHTEHVSDELAATKRLESLQAAGHTVVALSEERITRPTSARVATISIVGPIDRIQRGAELFAPIDPKVADRPALFERMTATITASGLELERWTIRPDNTVDIVVSCVAPVK